METVLLETNAINACFYKGYSGKQLANILLDKKLLPIVNSHTCYEIARTFDNVNNTNIGIALFTILKDLNPTYSCDTSELLKRQINQLIYENDCNYLIEEGKLIYLNKIINEVTQGDISKIDINRIRSRESGIKDNQSQWNDLFTYPEISNFEQFFCDKIKITDDIIWLINEICQETLNKFYAEKLIFKINDLLVIKTAIRANLYMSYLARKYKSAPSKDKTDDFRHLIDASLCSYFVTDEKKLKEHADYIIPELEIMTFDELIESRN
jgi:hypothetical protein